MDMHHAQYYITVYNCRSLSKAAKVHYVTQPVISRAVTALEEEFGCVFFERSKHGVIPTKAGIAFYDYALRCLDFYREMTRGMAAFSEENSLTLSIAGITPPVKEILPKAVAEFNLQYPSIKINIDRFVASEVLPLLQKDTYDFYITMMSDISSFPDLKSQVLLSERFQLITKTNVLPQTDAEAIRLLQTSPIYVMPEQDAPLFYQLIVSYLQEVGITSPDLRQARPIEALSFYVASNLGVTLCPPRHDFFESGLSTYMLRSGPTVELGICWRKETQPGKTFIRILSNLLQEQKRAGL